MPYKNMFNDLYSAFFLEYFDGHGGDNHYLLRFVIPYLENLHSSIYGISTFVKDNPFGKIICINWDDQGHFKMFTIGIPSFQTFQVN